MEGIFGFLEALAPIQALRFSRWGYAAVNTTHVLAIALLVGGSVPLALRLFGFWPTVPRAAIARILSLTAGAGLVLALLTGGLLFATRATEYVVNPAFQFKIALVTLGAVSTILAVNRYGRDMDGASDAAARRAAVISLVCWVGALVSGRLVAFV